MSTSEPKLIRLETERLYISELNPEIYRYLFTSCSDKEIMAYLGLTSKELDQEKDKYIKGMVTFFATFKNFRLLEKQSGKVIGRCGFHTWVESHQRAEIGYVITSEAHKCQHFMTEALPAVLAFGFEKMNLFRIEALVSPRNIPSLQLMKRFGFTKEGLLRSHYMLDGTLIDSAAFSLLRHEYEEQKQWWQVQKP